MAPAQKVAAAAAAVLAAPAFVAVPSAPERATSKQTTNRVSSTEQPGLGKSVPGSSICSTGSLVAGAALAAMSLAGSRQRKQTLKASRAVKVSMAASKVDCVGIVGCSGAVGQEMLKCLEQRNFPTDKVRLFAKRSAGTTVSSPKFGDIVVEPFSIEAAQECEICLLAVSGDFSLEYSPKIGGGPKNTQVVDNSSAWRMDANTPLVVPEINGQDKCAAPLIANPNCTTAVGAMALWPIHQKYKLKKVLMSTYQAASGAGAEGMAELENGLATWVKEGAVPKPEFFAHQLPFNVIPQIDKFQENGYTKEEMKVTWELQKIFGLPDDVKVSCTAVRVPTLRAHSESITIETEEPINPDDVRELLKNSQGVKVVDEPSSLQYPMPLNATGQEDVEVGRIRQSLVFGDHGIEFFVSGDQLLRGAALNAVIIAEEVVKARA
eukprot:TRINITY_DN626_c1_g1_i2.p1 TRINITY_DN626_c1_g1~~TRINITY_DN626_c1_g1_i2.p1  ORF type:complete len:436 (-),score=126.65 TRINITY_DN626_c1_g1_i2:48-1355(-)